MVAIGLAAAGCSGAEPADSTIDDRTQREVSERLKKAEGEGPQSLVCGDGKCKKGEDCSSCSADCGSCGACSHDICITGPALDASCDTCAADICAVDPFCCEWSWDALCVSEVASVCGKTCPSICGDSKCDSKEDCKSCASDCGTCDKDKKCSHDECVTGDPLGTNCSKCTEDVCAVDPYCCNVFWDGICVSEVDQYCKKGCGDKPKCGDGVCDVNAGESCSSCAADCGACPVPLCGDGKCDPAAGEDCSTCTVDCGSCGGSCDHDKCTTGGPLDASCDKCTDAICQVDSFCCTTAWDSICVSEVQSVCGDSSCGAPSCGNGLCEMPENCQTCAADCGACPVPACGDGKCDPALGEDCSTCAADCGGCGGSCDHDQCTSGGPLDASCGKCVDAICQVDPFCCTNAWDSICISQVDSVCGETCTAGCGDSICDASLGENCSTCVADCGGCPVPVCGDAKCDPAVGEDCSTCAADCGTCGGTCAHDICVTGKPLDANCDKCAAAICAVDSFCCNSMWDSICVSEVQSICGQTCSPCFKRAAGDQAFRALPGRAPLRARAQR
jgi:hypothetical protein